MNDGIPPFRVELRPRAYLQLSKDDQLQFSLYKLPNRFHRFMMRLLLGWVIAECRDITLVKPETRQLLNG